MADSIPPFPLAWPEGLPRTERKASSQFRSTLSAALKNVRKSLEMFAADSGKAVSNIVLSSNAGGLSLEQPRDTGVAAWFDWDGQQRCIGKQDDGSGKQIDRWIMADVRLETRQITHWKPITGPA